MKTKHTLICYNCKHENVLYKSTCKECNHYLRSTVVNIDLWKTIWSLFESPTQTIKDIIFAEHKNFVTILLIMLGAKIFLISTILNSLLFKPTINFDKSNIFFGTIINIILILLFVKVITFIFNVPQKRTRYKDNLAVTVYSNAPTILLLLLLTPIEYGIFGINWFDYNPSPLLIKESTAYILLSIEVIMLMWSLFLLLKSYLIQSNSIVKSAITILFSTSILLLIHFIPILNVLC